jgi:nitroimidazol reductase NimA-like FMN-containing flavoprotein (pyridoxamine 5'-phosphate oxidase superfamily)
MVTHIDPVPGGAMSATRHDTERLIISALDRPACEAVLARNSLGRVAYSFRNRVDIEPLHYVYSDGWLYGRTTPGSKLQTLRHSHWVAFEVEEVQGPFEWRSVVVHGGFYPLSPDAGDREADAWARGVELIRKTVPGAWTAEDPAAFRNVVFRIHVDELSGREARVRAESGDV